MFGMIFIRKLWNLTAEDVANKMGIHRTAVAGWERTKKVPLQRLDALSEMFDGLDKKYFSKELTEVDQLNIQHFKTMSSLRKEQLEYEKNIPEEFLTEDRHFYDMEREQRLMFNIDSFILELKSDLCALYSYDDISDQELRVELYKAIFEIEKNGAIGELLKSFLNAYKSKLNNEIPEEEYEMDLYFALYRKQKREQNEAEVFKMSKMLFGEMEKGDEYND